MTIVNADAMSDNRYPVVSIGLPVYNGERFLREALDSILAQTFRDFELIVSDNASTDQTEAICRAYAARDSRIRYYRYDRNRGAAWNYNNVTALSTGKYIKHAAHDDVLAPTYLERCVTVLEGDPAVALCYPLSVNIDEDGTRLPTGPLGRYGVALNLDSPKPHERFRVYHHNCNQDSGCEPVFGLMRASELKKTPVLGTYIGADLLLLAEMALRGKFYEVSEELFFVRVHKRQSTRANLDRDHLGMWFDPANKQRVRNQLFHWEWLFHYLEVIARVPLRPLERIRCYRQLPRWIWRHRARLTGDLMAAGSTIVRRIFGTEPHGPADRLSQVHQHGDSL